MREQPLPELDRCQRLGPAPLIRSRVQTSQEPPAPPAPADPPVLNEYGNDLQAHPELADVPF